MKSTFYIACHTKQMYEPEQYVTEAGKMANALQQVFNESSKILAIVRPANITACHTEVEIAHEENGLVGKCVVDIDAPTRVQLDKAKLSAILKATTGWPSMKIEKRTVVNVDDDTA